MLDKHVCVHSLVRVPISKVTFGLVSMCHLCCVYSQSCLPSTVKGKLE